MSVIVIGNDSLETDLSGDGNTEFRVSYRSFANAPPSIVSEQHVQSAVVAATGYDIGSAWITDSYAQCVGIKSRCVRRVDTIPPRWEWTTEYHFSSKEEDKQNEKPDKQKDKTERPLKLSIGIEKYDAPAVTDLYQSPVTNSAGDPISRTKKRSRIVLKYSRYVTQWRWEWCNEAVGYQEYDFNTLLLKNSFSDDYNTGFMYSTNFYEWTPVGPHEKLLGGTRVGRKQARIEDIRAEMVFDTPKPCVKVDIEVHVHSEGFADKFLDAGFFHFVTNNVWVPWVDGEAPPDLPAAAIPSKTRRMFRDANGAPVQQPQLLDGAGNALAAPFNDVWYRHYTYYPWRDWNVAPLSTYFS